MSIQDMLRLFSLRGMNRKEVTLLQHLFQRDLLSVFDPFALNVRIVENEAEATPCQFCCDLLCNATEAQETKGLTSELKRGFKEKEVPISTPRVNQITK